MFASHPGISFIFSSPSLHFSYVCFIILALFLSVLYYPGTYLIFILTFFCLLFHPYIYFICPFSSLLSFYLCFAMRANILSLLQGPCFQFIFMNHPCVSVICVSLICNSQFLLAFYFRFTAHAFVLYLLHHLSIRFILASRPLDSFYPYFTSAVGLVFALPYLHSFYFCFPITTFVLKDRTEIWALSN